jgi:hypothetical protein
MLKRSLFMIQFKERYWDGVESQDRIRHNDLCMTW